MESNLEELDESQIASLIDKTLRWRLGDEPNLPLQVVTAFTLTPSVSLKLLEFLCSVIDLTVNEKPESADYIFSQIKAVINDETKHFLANTAFEKRDAMFQFVSTHTPSLSRVLYHDWKIDTQLATESLGRISRPVATITLRIQPASNGSQMLPPLKSITLDLAKDMVDALNSGFDRLQNQLTKIVQ